jgi:hypothetical protein
MNTASNSTPKSNSFKTDVTDPSGAIHLCQWFSLNERPDSERREVAADLGTVILAEVCKPATFAPAPVAVQNTPWQGPDVAKMEAAFAAAFIKAVA